MSDRDERPDDDSAGSGYEQPEQGHINDPLTRTDVEAPRAPFGVDPES